MSQNSRIAQPTNTYFVNQNAQSHARRINQLFRFSGKISSTPFRCQARSQKSLLDNKSTERI
ncbi:hypothetical protein X975_24220, partial [Stegodyphus mimosarum]